MAIDCAGIESYRNLITPSLFHSKTYPQARGQHRAAGLQAFTNIYHVLLARETKNPQLLELPDHS
jgi:hypothetical protein